MMRIIHIIIFIAAVCSMGCATRYKCQKERSYMTAMQILRHIDTPDIFEKIESCEDVDTLRIIAFAASISAWPMEAGPNIDIDNRLDDISQVAMHRLFTINTDEANEAIECYKRAFPPDGAYSLLFKEWEEERKSVNAQSVKCN